MCRQLFKHRLPAASKASGGAGRAALDSAPAPLGAIDHLEPRRLLSAVITQPIAPVSVAQGGATTIDLKQNFSDSAISGTVTEFDTSLGNVQVQLTDQKTPLTVANFLSYVNQGLYNGTIIHRSIPGFVVQGGGYRSSGTHIPTGYPVPNEPGQSNVQGTIAMAKIGGEPDSATSEWFFNIVDNSRNLDKQNGGFTVFGNVISGFGVLQEINNLQTTNATLGSTSLSDVPIFNVPPGSSPTVQNLVTVNKVFVAPKDTFTAVSDVPGLVNPTIDSAGIMTLNVASNQSGYAHITVRATGLGGSVVADVFRVHVMANASRTLDVPIGGGKPGSLRLDLGPAASADVSIAGPGSAIVHLTGDNLKLTGQSVSGVNLQLDGITASGTTSASNLTVAGAKNARSFISVGDITTSGSLNTVTITNGILLGDLTIAGALRSVRIGQARDGTINVGAAGATLNVYLPTFANENLISAEPVGVIRAINWSDLDSVPEVVQAPSIGTIHAVRDFTPGVQVTGGAKQGLGQFNIGGNIGGVWQVPGRLPALTIGGIGGDFNSVFTQAIPSLRMAGAFSGSLTAPSIGSLFIRGGITGGALTLTAPYNGRQKDLGSLYVGQNVQQFTISSAGNIGSINVLSFVGSRAFAGVGPLAAGATFPTSASDFVSPARIDSFVTRSSSTRVGFQSSVVAASTLGVMALHTTTTNNNRKSFGFAARSIAAIEARDLSIRQTISLRNLTSGAAVSAQVAARKLSLGDLAVNVI